MAKERKLALLLTGPAIAVMWIGVALIASRGPGAFVFAIVCAIGFMAVPPVIQIGMLATERYGHRPRLACAVGMGVTVALLLVPLSLGAFNYH